MRVKPYRTVEEMSYYASDYNKWLGVECSKEMTVNNIDSIQYKRAKGIVRVTESKRPGEGKRNSQVELLKIMAGAFKILNSILQVLPLGNPCLNARKWLQLKSFPTEFHSFVAEVPF